MAVRVTFPALCFRLFAMVLTVAATPMPSAGADVSRVAELAQGLLATGGVDRSFCVTAKVTAVITSEYGNLLVSLRDASGNAFIGGIPSAGTAIPVPGDTIQARGKMFTCRNETSIPHLTDLCIVAHGEPEPLPEVSLAELISGAYDWVPVRVRGIVRDALPSETNPNWAILVLVDRQTYQYVSVPLNGDQVAVYESLIGSKVEVEGFCNPTDGSKRKHVGRIFQCRGQEAFKQVSPSPTDPFSVPDVTELRFLRPSEISTLERHRTSGRVLTTWNGKYALLENPAGVVVRLDCDRLGDMALGDMIEASGFPQSDFFHVTLSRATWRRIPCVGHPEPATADCALDEILNSNEQGTFRIIHYQGHRLSLSGRVHSVEDTSEHRRILRIEHGPDLVMADVSSISNAIRRLAPGSKVALTGTCVLDTENWRYDLLFPQIKGFMLVVNSAEDFRITADPPWWTTGRLTIVIGSLLALLAGCFIWNRSLKILAERYGRQLLREQLGHATAMLKTEERTRLAVELHDSLAQNLMGVSMEIETVKNLITHSPRQADAHLALASRSLKSCRDELRNCIWDLRSQALEETTLDRAIAKTLQPYVNESALSIRFAVPRSKLSDNTAHVILCVVRELVINAIRHGNAQSVKIAGGLYDAFLRCSVTDNGCGFDPLNCPGVLQGHFGVQGIRERVENLGGSVVIASHVNQGTKVTVSIPVPQERTSPIHEKDQGLHR